MAHGHGPLAPPHASHLPLTHALPSPQSALVVQSFVAPGSVVGVAQRPLLQTSPFGHSISAEHVVVHPAAVQTEPGGQLLLPVHGVFEGGVTAVQP